MAYKYQPLDLAGVKTSLETPGFLLKIMPHVDGSARICEFVKCYVVSLRLKGFLAHPGGNVTGFHNFDRYEWEMVGNSQRDRA
jgi:acetoacetate decarboxylase